MLPEPSSTAENRPLQEDVRFLSTALGDVIRRLAGDEVFGAIEELRVGCRDRRRGEEGAPELAELAAAVDQLGAPVQGQVARGFTLFFMLINTAEQVHRERLRRAAEGEARSEARISSARWAFEQLANQGRSADEVAAALRKMAIRPVLTAHPTEATRRTILSLQARVADLLLARDSAAGTVGAELDQQLQTEVELLWLTSEVRQDRPSVLDEVSNVLWYLEDRLVTAVARVSDRVERAFAEVFERELTGLTPVQTGSWVGGDRDGNPFVTPEVTVSAARRNSYAVLDHYHRELGNLIERLSLSETIASAPDSLRESLEADRELLPEVWVKHNRRDRDEPLRLKLSFMQARIEHLMKEVATRRLPEPKTHPGA
ncbi:MAG: phosphoenolpyruvate carboxylase, partial [Deltaproteobacteria bacterium]|nr:phosphoenolpyruvate carboxylase [Deltaproteobacteria bacterium]